MVDLNNLQDIEECDGEMVSYEELCSSFSSNCKLLIEEKVVNNKYILYVDGTYNSSPKVAVGFSENIVIYDLSNNHFSKQTTLNTHKNNELGLKFSTENNNLLYCGLESGSVTLWDLRANQVVNKFDDNTLDNLKTSRPFACFDVSPNNRLLAVGTELYEGDAFMLFWDIRNTKLLGGYWESHTEDITQLKFSPDDPDKLISGSTDGLINIYNLKESCEDDALIDCLNTASSVAELQWFGHGYNLCIECVTHTNDVQLWNVNKGEPYAIFQRNHIAEVIKRKSKDHCYVLSVNSNSRDLSFLAGSTWDNGETIRGVKVDGCKLMLDFDLNENKQIVRSCWYNCNNKMLITAGEQGIVNIWQV